MAFEFTVINSLGAALDPEWGDQVKNAIIQLANDVYATPSRTPDGAGLLASPVQQLAINAKQVLLEGETAPAGPDGFTIDLTALGLAGTGSYKVLMAYEGDPGPGAGYLWAVKNSATQATIHNSDAGADAGCVVSWAIIKKG